MKTASPRVAFFDIETAPSLGYFWGRLWETNIINVQVPWYMLSFAYKWMGEKKVHWHGLSDYKTFKQDKENDSLLLGDLQKMLNQADVVIAHNGDKFDLRKANARFVTQGLAPPRPFKTIDTLKVARKHFDFESNKLNDIAQYLGVGKKLPHTGFDLWKRCMDGDEDAWRIMKAYNSRDIVLLEGVYDKLKPYMTNHPNLNVYREIADMQTRPGPRKSLDEIQCPTCQSWNTHSSGLRVNRTRAYRLYRCWDCTGWIHGETVKV